MVISPAKRSLRLRASAEAFEVLRTSKSPRISNAELLKHAVRSDHEPHPRVVREVHQALKEAQAARPAGGPSVLKKISGVFSRAAVKAEPSVDEIVRRFEQAFVQPD
ncbi:MAG TPA: hypothetical protein VGM13_08075 [Thermoanaerobaculia bacterium]|jgi:hypothetical protein